MKRRIITLGLSALVIAGGLMTSMRASLAEPFYSRAAELRPKGATTMRFILDGVEYPADQLPAGDAGRTYVLTRAGQQNGVVHVFSSNNDAARFMRSVMARRSAATMTCEHTQNYSQFNKCAFASCAGSNLFMDREPSTVTPSRYTQLDTISWNNSISYVAAACNDYWTVIYSCRNFQLFQSSNCGDPDKYAVEPGLIIEDLNWIGWNNRTSSMRFCSSSLEPCIE